MKKYILMTLVTATALSSISAHADPVAPVSADMMVDDVADIQREERRAERQEERAERQEARAERQEERAERTPEQPAERPPIVQIA
ncbi:MAG: hypothetical protein JHD25_02745, partial [Sphingomonadaceae bacterium]|nr:hypothetical protein [Sphingomonadaceae bacterium]